MLKFTYYRYVLVMLMLFVSGNAYAMVISNIQQLDDAALFSFAIISDNKGYDARSWTIDGKSEGQQAQRMETWIPLNDEFCLGVGDHIFPHRDRFDYVMRTNSFFHNHFYPVIGDHDNETKLYDYNGVIGNQNEWGRGWVVFKALNNFFNRPEIQWRQPQSSKVNSGGTLYDDQLVDYYATRQHSGFTIHILGLHYGDSSAFAPRTKQFMMDKLAEISVNKTSKDIIVVLAHAKGHFFTNAMNGGYMNQSEVDYVMNTADLVCDASNHIFQRHDNYDASYDGNQALWINTGAVVETGSTKGYVNIHVFDNPPMFTMQYINCSNSTRNLHVGQLSKVATQIDKALTVPVLKYIDGPIENVNWNSFPVGPTPNNAEFVSQNVPTYLDPGQTTTVDVTLRNSGDDAWSIANGQSLGTQNPQGNTLWEGSSRIELTQTVSSNQQHTFSFNITAPLTPGVYDFQWQMVDDEGDNVGWFGPKTPNVSITVGQQPIHVEAENFDSNTGFNTQSTSDAGGGLNISHADAGDMLGYDLDIGKAGDYEAEFRVASFGKGAKFDFKIGTQTLLTIDEPATGDWQAWVTTAAQVISLPSGIVTVNITANDGGWNLNWFKLTPVVSVNSAPQITSTPILSLQEGSPYSYNITATDADGDMLTFSAQAIPNWLSFNSQSALLSGTPWGNEVGDHAVSLRVYDGTEYGVQSFTITVTDSPIPVGPPGYIFAVRENEEFVIPQASDLAYGADGHFNYLYEQSGTVVFNNVTFGDPKPGTPKAGFYKPLPLQGYDLWAANNSVGAVDADDDGDGLSNLLEFAVGGNPKSATSELARSGAITNNGTAYELKFHRAEDSVTYTVERSTDLINWVTHSTDPGSVGSDVTVSVPETAMNNGKLFLRLKVEN